MSRLFTFGCSYTSYSWPTWSNLLELEFDHVENWAMSGLGNRAIAERIAECHVKNQFTKDDTIIVQWSSHLRNDWYSTVSMPERTSGWKTYGSIFNYHNQSLYDKKWIETFFYEPAFLMHTLNHIAMTQGLLNSVGATWYMTSIGDIRNMGEDLRAGDGYGETTGIFTGDSSQEKLAWIKLPSLKVYEKSIWDDHKDHWLMPMELFCQTCPDLTFEFIDNATNTPFLDIHPSTAQHALWIEQELQDKLSLSSDTMRIANQLAAVLHRSQPQFKRDKRAFELSLAKKAFFPENANKIKWPGRPVGY